MKKFIKLFVSAFVLLLAPATFVSAETVKSLDFTAVTRTEKVIVIINNDEQTLEYLTPAKDYRYIILDYDYSADYETESSVVRGTVLDTLLNTESKFVIYSNGKFSDMRIGKKQVTFTYVEEFDVKG